MVIKRLINAQRERRLPASYSWVDHRLMRGKFIHGLNVHEIALYFFLVLVGDNHGLSYYGDKTVCRALSMKFERLYPSREGLVRKSLIAYEPPLYQVLELPAYPVKVKEVVSSSRSGMAVIGDIFRQMSAERSEK